MNKRIQALITQSTTAVDPDDREWVFSRFDKEKFAELIVRECADRLMQDDFASTKGIMRIAGARLKEHFGVEE